MKHLVEQKFAQFEYLDGSNMVLVGVSGGVDSVVLVHLLVKFGYQTAIAHCNFGLRGKQSDDDEIFTKKLAEKINVPFFSKRFNTQTYAKARGISIQMAARSLRYFWFAKLCKQNGFSQIAIGTHLTDNIETFLFNATKGTGLSGLRGIKQVNGKIVRPLLYTTKDQIYEYARLTNLMWREDTSNRIKKYQRNKIRHDILPVLKDINPNFEATFERNFSRLSRVEQFVLREVDKIWKQWVQADNKGWRIAVSNLSNHPFSDVILSYKLSAYGFNTTHISNILQAINNSSGKQVSSNEYIIYIDRETIFIHSKRHTRIPQQYSITEFMGEIQTPIHLRFHDTPRGEVKVEKFSTKAYFDFDKLTFPLTLRKWQNGDRMKPFGMRRGTKKVSDILIDLKIPVYRKKHTWVLESGDEICWLVGVRTSERYKVTDNTQRVYTIELLG